MIFLACKYIDGIIIMREYSCVKMHLCQGLIKIKYNGFTLYKLFKVRITYFKIFS